MAEETPIQREVYAIPDDDIDIRLLQRQIANAIASSKNGGKKPSSIGKPDFDPIKRAEGETTPKDETKNAEEVAAPTSPIEKEEPLPLVQATVKNNKTINSKEDSMDINELMNDSMADVSLDLLEQLTSKIASEMGDSPALEDAVPQEKIPATPVVDMEDLIEENINNVESEELLAEHEINKDSEKTIVTEQISEYPINQFDAEYIQSLDYLDGDKKYKKYVIYIDDVNVDFIDSLSIAERKNLINGILREQDDIRIARREEERMRKLVTHVMIGIITFFVIIPLMYWLVNACLEATIDNYRRSQNNFEVLYKERGKIKAPSKH